jgi:hypothetical protein
MAAVTPMREPAAKCMNTHAYATAHLSLSHQPHWQRHKHARTPCTNTILSPLPVELVEAESSCVRQEQPAEEPAHQAKGS